LEIVKRVEAFIIREKKNRGEKGGGGDLPTVQRGDGKKTWNVPSPYGLGGGNFVAKEGGGKKNPKRGGRTWQVRQV